MIYDPEFKFIKDYLENQTDLNVRFVDTVWQAVAHAICEIADCVDDLQPAEKTTIGSRWERNFKNKFEIPQGVTLDCKIGDIEFDCKFTIKDNWMIPPSCVNKICLLAQYKSNDGKVRLGVIRTKEEYLVKKTNSDRKKGLSKIGKQNIDWIVDENIKSPTSRSFR